MAALYLEDQSVDQEANNPRQENHEGIHDTLDKRQGDHIAVGGMADFVGQNGFDLASFHTAEKTCAYRDERRVLLPSRGEGVRRRMIENPNFRHGDAGPVGLRFHGRHDPALRFVPGLVDDRDAHRRFRHGLREKQRDEGAGEADHGGIDEKRRQVEIDTVRLQQSFKAQQAKGQADQGNDRQIGAEE